MMVVIILQYRNESKQAIVQLKHTQCGVSIILHKAGEKVDHSGYFVEKID